MFVKTLIYIRPRCNNKMHYKVDCNILYSKFVRALI